MRILCLHGNGTNSAVSFFFVPFQTWNWPGDLKHLSGCTYRPSHLRIKNISGLTIRSISGHEAADW